MASLKDQTVEDIAQGVLPSRWAAWRRDLLIAWRRRVHPGDPEGRGAAWLADYDASSPDVLAV